RSGGVTLDDLATVVPAEVTRLAAFISHQQHPSVYDGIRDANRDRTVLSGQEPRDQRDPQLMSILFATNRVVKIDNFGHIGTESFTSERSLEKLTFGSVLVRVPENHQIGIIERPWDLTVWGVTVARRERSTDHFVFRGMRTLGEEEFVQLLKTDRRSGALVFVHGYANTFDDAVFRAAQVAWDT